MMLLRIDDNTIDIRLGTETALLLSRGCSLATEHHTMKPSAAREFLYCAHCMLEAAALAAQLYTDQETELADLRERVFGPSIVDYMGMHSEKGE